MNFTEDKMLARYKELCQQRDATYAKTSALEEKLSEINALAEKYRLEAEQVAKQIDVHLNSEHFERKKEIAFLARALGRPGGPLATKE